MQILPTESPLKVLVVDDDRATLLRATRVLERAGYLVIAAEDGYRAMEAFELQRPDLVLTDFQMPGLNGAELARLIRARTVGDPDQEGHYVPVMIFTAGQEPELLQQGLGAGAIQFLTKPFGNEELLSRLQPLAELVRMQRQIVAGKQQQEEEIALVKRLMDQVIQEGLRDLPEGFWMRTLATRRVHGDVCSHRQGAPGIHYGCMVDPMGHGLMAAYSVLALLEVFRALGSLGHSLGTIYDEMNRKHRLRFPHGRFSCALLLRLDAHHGRLSVLNAGLPLVLLLSQDGTVRAIPSESIPVGILDSGGCTGLCELSVKPGDRFFACTDGLTDIIEQSDLEALLKENGDCDPNLLIQAQVRQRIGMGEQHDDVSWLLWTVPEPPSVPSAVTPGAEAGALVLSMDLEFEPGVLDYAALGPHLAKFLGQVGLENAQAQTLALVLAEGLTNAVEHGLLCLDSSLKEGDWEAWETARRVALVREDGRIQLRLRLHAPTLAGQEQHRVDVWVEDPGPGFDWRLALQAPSGLERPHGRGLQLMRALAQQVGFNDAGNVLQFIVSGP